MILFLAAVGGYIVRDIGHLEQAGEVQALGLPVFYRLAGVQPVHAPDHLVDGAEAHLRHYLTQFFGYEEEVVDGVFGLTGELLAEFGVLGGYADRAGVHVALAEHYAAERDERRGRHAELLGAEQTGYRHVAARLYLPVGLDDYAPAQVVFDQHLLGLGDAKLPGQAGVLDGCFGRRARAAAVAAYEDDVAVSLGDARGYGADACLGYQFDVNPGLRVGVLQVVYELRQVFDGVYVVMRRGRDKLDAGRRVANPAYVFVHLVAGQLSTLAGLGALRHLYLQVLGVGEVSDGHAEATGSNLLYSAVARVAVGVERVAMPVLAALAGVGTRADAVHGYGERLVRLAAYGAE